MRISRSSVLAILYKKSRRLPVLVAEHTHAILRTHSSRQSSWRLLSFSLPLAFIKSLLVERQVTCLRVWAGLVRVAVLHRLFWVYKAGSSAAISSSKLDLAILAQMDKDMLKKQIENMKFQATMDRWPLSKSIAA